MKAGALGWLVVAWTMGGAMADQALPAVEGTARDAKGGAVVVDAQGAPIYVAGLAEWPAALAGRRVRLEGAVRTEAYLPQAEVGPDGAISQGARGAQRGLREGRWRLVDAGEREGLPLRRGAPHALPNGASVTLEHVHHKQQVDGPVVGIWELSVRKGEAARRVRVVAERGYAELDAFGHGAVVTAEGEDVRVHTFPAAQAPLDEDGAARVADELARALGHRALGTARTENAGVHSVELSARGTLVLSLRIGAVTRRVLAGSWGVVAPKAAAPAP